MTARARKQAPEARNPAPITLRVLSYIDERRAAFGFTDLRKMCARVGIEAETWHSWRRRGTARAPKLTDIEALLNVVDSTLLPVERRLSDSRASVAADAAQTGGHILSEDTARLAALLEQLEPGARKKVVDAAIQYATLAGFGQPHGA